MGKMSGGILKHAPKSVMEFFRGVFWFFVSGFYLLGMLLVLTTGLIAVHVFCGVGLLFEKLALFWNRVPESGAVPV